MFYTVFVLELQNYCVCQLVYNLMCAPIYGAVIWCSLQRQ